ncbi:hypothetical protein V6N13_114065 [Hibiscus sabdariffa]
MFARLSISRDHGLVAEFQVKPASIQLIREKQLQDSAIAAHVQDIAEGKPTEFRFRDEGVLCFKDRIVVPENGELRRTILTEAHSSPFSMHRGSTKMYQDLKNKYYWVGLKKDVAEFVSKCMGTWEKQLPLVEFAYNNNYQATIQMAPYEALYGRRCRTPVCWAEAGQKLLPMPDILKGTTEKVKLISERLKVASDRQKSYADLKRREIEYAVGDRVFLKVSS